MIKKIEEILEAVPFTTNSKTAESVLTGEDVEGATPEAT